MKAVSIDNKHREEVIQWCLENLGTEGRRWWFSSGREWVNASGGYAKMAPVITFDVTEEEEDKVTFFMLKYA